MRQGRFELPLRIVVEDPVPGLQLALQRGSSAAAEIVGAAASSGGSLVFELSVSVNGALPDGRPRLVGPFVQGPPADRFIYLCVGEMAGQAGSAWRGRVKVPLGGLTWEIIEALPPGARLEARTPGRGRNAGPALATVPILPPGWRPAS